MDIGAGLRALDRRVESKVSGRKPKYDVEPPKWLQYSSVIFIMIIFIVGMMLTFTAGPRVSLVTDAVLLFAYTVVLLSWTRRHRVRD
ncbi:MAG: hypothetical protein QOJ79_1259 [Actinomycetota bacterium]|jgi:hypothetical protein|nr:hypothetical protein [Actinomycetota bacterium]